MFLSILDPPSPSMQFPTICNSSDERDGISQLSCPVRTGSHLVYNASDISRAHRTLPYLNEGSRMSDREVLGRTLSRGRIGVIVAKRDTKHTEIG